VTVQVWKAAARLPEINWRSRPSRRCLAAVRDRLGPEAADRLTHARVRWESARDVLNGREPLPMTNSDVEQHLVKVREGRMLHPVVVNGPVIVDGHHVVSVAYYRSPTERVPVLDVAESESTMSKKSKVKVRKASTLSLEDQLSAIHVAVRRNDLSPQERFETANAIRGAEGELARQRSWATESAPSDNDYLIGKAQKLRKSDPDLGEYESLRQASRRAA
jgi:hypothetical protein